MYLKRGKKNVEMKFAIFGMLLIIFGYFTPNIWWTIGIGLLLCFGPFLPMGQKPQY